MAEKKEVKIPEMLFFQEGPGVRNIQYTTSGVKLLNVANLVEGKVDLSTSDRYISEDVAYGKYNHFLCDEDDFIVASSGIKVDYIDKKMGFITKEMLPLCMNTSTIRFKVLDDSKLNIRYFMYFLKSNAFKKQLAKQITGSAQLNYGPSHLKQMTFPLIDIKSQNDLVKKLDYLIQIMDKKNESIRKYDDLIKARFVEMFGTSGANPKGWNEIKLGEVCSLQNGYAFKSSDYINKSSVLNCRMSNIRPDGGFDAEYHPKYLPDEYWDKCSGYRLFDGDVIIAMTDMASDPKILGVPTIVSTNGKKFLLNQRVGKLSFLHDDRMNRVYLMHSLGQKYIRKELAKSAAGSTQINVGKPAILNINIYDPPRSLQDQFATFVAQVDKSKFALQNNIKSLMNLWYNINQYVCERTYGEA